MNSFLIFASKTGYFPTAPTIAVKFNELREDRFKSHIEFERNVVIKNGIEEFYLADHKNLGDEIVDAIYLNQTRRAYKLLMDWYDLLNSKVLKKEDIELIPANILKDNKTGKLTVIDLEYKFLESVPTIQLIIDRGMLDIISKLNRYNREINITQNGQWGLSEDLKSLLPPQFKSPYLKELAMFESWFKCKIFGGDLKEIKNNLDCFLEIKKNYKAKVKKILKRIINKAKRVVGE